MLEFDYLVLDSSGKRQSGSIKALNYEVAKNSLKEKGLLILELKEKNTKLFRNPLKLGISRSSIKDEDLYTLFVELAILLKSGLNLDKALEIFLSASPNQSLRDALAIVLQRLKEGHSLRQAFEEAAFLHPITLNMISAGEAVGKISSVFENIADYYKFKIQFKNELKNSLAYPLFLIFASFITIFIIFRYILPKFFVLFSPSDLPFFAKFLYYLGLLFSYFKWYIIITMFILVFFFIKYISLQKIAKLSLSILFKIPYIKNLMLYMDYSRFSFFMYSMLKSGVNFVDSLSLSKNLVINKKLRNHIESAIDEIKRGKSISQAFTHSDVVLPIFYNMIKVGEESGNLKDIFMELHNMYDEKVKNNIKRILSMVEPVIILFTGLIISLIVISIILTIISAGSIKF